VSPRSNVVYVRLNDEEKQIVRKLAIYYDIAESDIIRIAIKEFAKTREVQS